MARLKRAITGGGGNDPVFFTMARNNENLYMIDRQIAEREKCTSCISDRVDLHLVAELIPHEAHLD